MQPEAYVAHHFPNLRQQEHAARLGMWLFLATEILLFGGLFTAYSVYRFLYPLAFEEGFLPGRYFASAEFTTTGAPMFFTLYFLLTGLHGLHVVVGMTVLAVLGVLTWRGRYDHGYVTPVELGAMYWHLVDLIWIFLYPLLYLI